MKRGLDLLIWGLAAAVLAWSYHLFGAELAYQRGREAQEHGEEKAARSTGKQR